jgi:hypothetical protein
MSKSSRRRVFSSNRVDFSHRQRASHSSSFALLLIPVSTPHNPNSMEAQQIRSGTRTISLSRTLEILGGHVVETVVDLAYKDQLIASSRPTLEIRRPFALVVSPRSIAGGAIVPEPDGIIWVVIQSSEMHVMAIPAARCLGFVLLLSSLPVGMALAAGGGGAAGAGSSSGVGAGVGAMGTGSAAVGGGAPAGRVGGGPPAGEVGGGAPGSANPEGNGAAGTGNPGANAGGVTSVPSSNPASGLENAPTAGGVIGGSTGVPPASTGLGSASPPITGQSQPNDTRGPKAVEGVAEEPPPSTVGLAEPGPDGVSTKIVAPKPCSAAAHETDGTTTCVGIPAGR